MKKSILLITLCASLTVTVHAEPGAAVFLRHLESTNSDDKASGLAHCTALIVNAGRAAAAAKKTEEAWQTELKVASFFLDQTFDTLKARTEAEQERVLDFIKKLRDEYAKTGDEATRELAAAGRRACLQWYDLAMARR